MRAVGSHKERLDNLYFAFLFTLRAVVKAGTNLMAFPYATGYSKEDAATRAMMAQLVNASLPEHLLRDLDRGQGVPCCHYRKRWKRERQCAG